MRKNLLLIILVYAFCIPSQAHEGDKNEACSRIERKVDEFEGETHLNSPLFKSSSATFSPMIIYKDIKKGKAVYYLRLNAVGQTVVVGEKGATILFTDGTKLTKSVDIDVDPDDDGFRYNAFISLSATDLATLSTKKVKKFRLYIFDQTVAPEEAADFTSYVSCIRNQK